MDYTISSKAKINLTLDVIEKRDDGYHNLKTIMQSISLSDDIIIKKQGTDIRVNSNLPYLPKDSKNIAYKAARLFLDDQNINNVGFDIYINKKIPVAAGLAGGSSNAASVLTLLNEIFQTNLDKSYLEKLGSKIGADVVFCLNGGTMLCEGIGDILTPLNPMPKAYILLAKPEICVSTAHIFGKLDVSKINLHPDTEGVIKAISNNDLYNLSKRMYNVLEEITAREYPIIKKYEEIMIEKGAVGSIMTGSGPTVFGIFNNKNYAENAMDKLLEFTKEVFLTEN